MSTCVNPYLLVKYDDTKLGFEKFRGPAYDTVAILLKSMNAIATVKIYTSFKFVDEHGESQGFLRDMITGETEFTATKMLMQFWKVHTYPHQYDGVCMISPNVPIKTKYMDKFLSVFTPDVWLYFAAACCLSVAAVKYIILEKPMYQSIMEFLRMFVSAASLGEPRDSTKRILFMFLLLLIFATNSFIMSHVSSISTVPDRYIPIDSSKDLIDSKLSYYGYRMLKELIEQPVLRERFQADRGLECRQRLWKGERVVCIAHCSLVRAGKYEGPNVHVAKNNLVNLPEAFVATVDWPLYSRINLLLLEMDQGGLHSLIRKRHQLYFSQMSKTSDEHASSITIQEVYYCFGLFLGGFMTALFMFVGEILIYNCKKMLDLIEIFKTF